MAEGMRRRTRPTRPIWLVAIAIREGAANPTPFRAADGLATIGAAHADVGELLALVVNDVARGAPRCPLRSRIPPRTG